MEAASLVSSSRSAGSLGAGRVSDNFSNFILRCVSAERSRPSKRRDCSANSVVAPIRFLFAPAESASVSSLMNVLLTQSARANLKLRQYKRFSASAMNFSASAGVALPEREMVPDLLVQDDIIANPRLTRRNPPAQSWRV